MKSRSSAERKRPVNITLSEELVARARIFTPNLSAKVEELLAEYVVESEEARAGIQAMADDCVADWNAVHDAVGSYADEHVRL